MPRTAPLFVCLFIVIPALAQAPETPDLRTRQIWDTELLEKRPTSGKAPVARKVAVKRSQPNGALVGITLWRFRASRPSDDRAVRAMIHEGGAKEELTPERVAADQPLAEGQRLRIGIEVAQEGYLYVIDRDHYADGTKGVPYLIFPTSKILGGHNKVNPGMLVELPSAADNPPYFKMERSQPNQTEEVLTILISAKPIPGLAIAGNRQKIDEAQLAKWEKQWKLKSYKLGDAKQGQAYTAAEKQAANGGKALGKTDPLPQTMYHVDSQVDGTLMLDLPLRMAK